MKLLSREKEVFLLEFGLVKKKNLVIA